MKHYVNDKVVLITGGSSGFGKETARLLLELGAQVVITGRNRERLDAAARDLGGDGALQAIRADACEVTDWARLLDDVYERHGRLDVCVMNHGAGVEIAETETLDDETVDAIIDINITSVIKGSREVVRRMKAQGRGYIVTVASACSYHSWPGWGPYTAAKAGLVAFTRCLHLEMSGWGGKAGCFIPGAAKTGFCQAANLDDSFMAGFPTAEEFARTLVHTIDVPDSCFIEEVNIWGTAQVPAMVNPF